MRDRRCLRLFAAGGLLCSLRDGEELVSFTRQDARAYLCSMARRKALAPRRGGRMHNDAARDAFPGPEIKLLMPLRDLVSSVPRLWACPRWEREATCGVDARTARPFSNRCESTGVCRRGFVSRILSLSPWMAALPVSQPSVLRMAGRLARLDLRHTLLPVRWLRSRRASHP